MKTEILEEVLIQSTEQLRSPIQLEELMLQLKGAHADLNLQNPYHWGAGTLSDGYPGVLLFFSTLNRMGRGYEWTEEIEHLYVVKIKEILEKRKVYGLSLFSGLAGVCFSVFSASHDGSRYQKMLDTLDKVLIDGVEKQYLKPLEKDLGSEVPSPSHTFDLIQGVSGIGRYALERIENRAFETLVNQILTCLTRRCKTISIDGYSVPGWYLLLTDVLNMRKIKGTHGNFDLGLSHGISGVLAFLSLAYLRGCIVEGQESAIVLLSEWLIQKSFRENQTIRWAPTVSWEEEVEKMQPSFHNSYNDSWCYGVPGISRSIFLAGKALKNPKTTNFALEAFEGIFSRAEAEWNLPGPAICHGLSGLLYSTKIMSYDNNNWFHDQERALSKKILGLYNPSNIFGFSDLEMDVSGKYVPVNKPGILEGAAGILLTLLLEKKKETTWDLPLLFA